MATRTDSMPGDGRAIYPWDEWLDGSVWKLTPGEDFKTSSLGFRSLCSQQALRRGGRARVSYAPTRDEHFYLQFIPD